MTVDINFALKMMIWKDQSQSRRTITEATFEVAEIFLSREMNTLNLNDAGKRIQVGCDIHTERITISNYDAEMTFPLSHFLSHLRIVSQRCD